MNKYYRNNKLQMNVSKTCVMLISNDEILKEENIIIEGNQIKHGRTLKILGTVLNENLDWNSHINEGQNSLLAQLKKRLNSLKYIARYVSTKFARQLGNSLLISKLCYNIDIWGHTSKQNIKKIDSIIHQAAKTVLGSESIGRSNKWMLSKLKWLNTNLYYENAMQNNIYKIINLDNDHDFKHYFTANRSIRLYSENKIGSHNQTMGQSPHTQKSFLYRAVALYNKLPRNLTLIKSHSIFKKWCKAYNLDNNIKLREREYNVAIRERFLIDRNVITECENGAIF